MNKKMIVLQPMVVGTVWSGLVFIKASLRGIFDWRFYASLTGFVILLTLTIWFGYLLIKKYW